MIANKHTELRIYDNLNSLLRASLDEKEYKERINRHITQYIRNYVDEESWNKNVYDVFEGLGNSYEKHCWNIAKNIKDEILEEKKETNWLDPNVYTDDFQETMVEELTNKVIPHYFKELNNQISVYEYKNKIDKLRVRNKKKVLCDNKNEIDYIIRARLDIMYNIYLERTNNNSQLVIDNFKLVQEFKDMLIEDALEVINKYLDNEIVSKEDIQSLFDKHLNSFIKEKQGIINATIKNSSYPQQQVQYVNTQINIPKSLQAYAMASILEDITK